MSSRNWEVRLTRQAERDLRYWQKKNVGHPEWLKGKLAGCMSRRITWADRCVYQVLKKKKIIKVLQMRFHYDD